MQAIDQANFAFLFANSKAAMAKHTPCFSGMDQPIGLWNYIRIANDISKQTSPGRLLDWGCGFGQMTYLLHQRGFQVIPFDVGASGASLPDLPLTHNIPPVVRTSDPIELPFQDGQFDEVLSCGVLEHVEEGTPKGDERESLKEIARVMRPGGLLFLYQLPQRYAWQEALIRRFKKGYAHSRRYNAREIRALLLEAGFTIQRLRHANLIPKNLTGMPASLRSLYSRFSHPLISLDSWASQIPVLNQFAGVLEITARCG
jgi:2-polyprenyl-3-methyl-5-hydroxy-6-metoxy-1,4-benzoquinol methylase